MMSIKLVLLLIQTGTSSEVGPGGVVSPVFCLDKCFCFFLDFIRLQCSLWRDGMPDG